MFEGYFNQTNWRYYLEYKVWYGNDDYKPESSSWIKKQGIEGAFYLLVYVLNGRMLMNFVY